MYTSVNRTHGQRALSAVRRSGDRHWLVRFDGSRLERENRRIDQHTFTPLRSGAAPSFLQRNDGHVFQRSIDRRLANEFAHGHVDPTCSRWTSSGGERGRFRRKVHRQCQWRSNDQSLGKTNGEKRNCREEIDPIFQDTTTCEFVRTLLGHKRGIACLQYRDKIVVSGSSDNTIRVRRWRRFTL